MRRTDGRASRSSPICQVPHLNRHHRVRRSLAAAKPSPPSAPPRITVELRSLPQRQSCCDQVPHLGTHTTHTQRLLSRPDSGAQVPHLGLHLSIHAPEAGHRLETHPHAPKPDHQVPHPTSRLSTRDATAHGGDASRHRPPWTEAWRQPPKSPAPHRSPPHAQHPHKVGLSTGRPWTNSHQDRHPRSAPKQVRSTLGRVRSVEILVRSTSDRVRSVEILVRSTSDRVRPPRNSRSLRRNPRNPAFVRHGRRHLVSVSEDQIPSTADVHHTELTPLTSPKHGPPSAPPRTTSETNL